MKKCVDLGMFKFMEQTKVIKQTTSLFASGHAPSTISINDLTASIEHARNLSGDSNFLKPHAPQSNQRLSSKMDQRNNNDHAPTFQKLPTSNMSFNYHDSSIPPAHPKPQKPSEINFRQRLRLAETPEFHKNLEVKSDLLKKVEVLGKLFQTFEYATTEDLSNVESWTHGSSAKEKEQRCKHFGELSVVAFKLTTLFYMELPEIELLELEVQEQIIKKSILQCVQKNLVIFE